MATEVNPETDNTEVFQTLETYPWDQEGEFQGGLAAILGSNTPRTQAHELTLRAQCFYFSRKKGITVDFDAYKAYLSPRNLSLSSPTPTQSSNHPCTQPQTQNPSSKAQSSEPSHHEADFTTPSQENAPYPQTFSQIVSLITSGAPIPGVKDIPPTLLSNQATKPMASKRRKPWEKDIVERDGEGEGGKSAGTFGDRRDKVIVQDVPES
jgi:hypothetical protein